MADSKLRSVLKGLTWRLLASTSTVVVVYLVTKDVVASFQLGMIEFVLKWGLYFLHERAYVLLYGERVNNKIFFLKSLTWRLLAVIIIAVLTFSFFRGNDQLIEWSTKVVLFDTLAKILMYYFHERVWHTLPRNTIRILKAKVLFWITRDSNVEIDKDKKTIRILKQEKELVESQLNYVKSKLTDAENKILTEGALKTIENSTNNRVFKRWLWLTIFSIIFISISYLLVVKHANSINISREGTHFVLSLLIMLLSISMVSILLYFVKFYFEKYQESTKSQLINFESILKGKLGAYSETETDLLAILKLINETLKNALAGTTKEKRSITYFGALGLQSFEIGDNEVLEKGNNNNSLSKEINDYKTNMEKGEVTRYINFSSVEDEFPRRNPKMRKNYLAWLSNLLAKSTGDKSDDPKIYHAGRAPSWLNSTSYIVTYDTILYILGSSSPHFLLFIRGRESVKRFIQAYTDYLGSAKEENNRPSIIDKQFLAQHERKFAEIEEKLRDEQKL